jgi:excisionase family DNA binding protein
VGPADPVELITNAITRLLAADMLEELLAIVRETFARNAFAERLAYSLDEAAELLGISRELVHDLLRTGQLGSVKAGRRRLIAKTPSRSVPRGRTLKNGRSPGSSYRKTPKECMEHLRRSSMSQAPRHPYQIPCPSAADPSGTRALAVRGGRCRRSEVGDEVADAKRGVAIQHLGVVALSRPGAREDLPGRPAGGHEVMSQALV